MFVGQIIIYMIRLDLIYIAHPLGCSVLKHFGPDGQKDKHMYIIVS